ncbi:MAG: cupin domain-containing protein [Calditrichia bacterium]
MEELEQKVTTLSNMIEYQEGAVVSKIILKKTSGSVTLFAFDKSQNLSEHTVPYDALVQVIDGEAEIIIAGQPFRLGAGQMIIMPANKPHAVNAVQRFKMILTMLKSE